MVNETPLEQSEHGLVPAGAGWFVANVRSRLTRYVDGLLPSGERSSLPSP